MEILIKFVNNVFVLLGLNPDRERATIYAGKLAKVIKSYKLELTDIEDYVLDHYTGYKYPSIKLFLDSFGYESNETIYDKVAEQALQNILPKIVYMKESKCYTSQDKVLLTTIQQMGGVRAIMGSYVTVNGNYEPIINSYSVRSFSKAFKAVYINIIKNKIQLVSEIGRNERKFSQLTTNILINYDKNQVVALIGSVKQQKLIGG